MSAATGVDASTIRRLAHEIATAPTAAVYGRIGTTTTEFGSTASWLIDAVNILSGNLDRPGGSMFTTPVAGGPLTRGKPGSGRGFSIGRGATRVSGHPEVMGEYPVAALAEEITTEGEGRLRGLVTLAGNPVLSSPNSDQLAGALDELEFMVSIDMYLNETTRHADVILPPPSQLQRGHYDVMLLQFAVRNTANYSEPVLPLEEGQPDEWEIISKLTLVAQGHGVDADPALADEMMIDGMVRGAVKDERSPVGGRDADELLAELAADGRRGPARVLDFMLRTGPFGDGFGLDPNGTSLDDLLGNPHGRDFGALVPRLPDILRTPSGKVELAPDVFVDDLGRLEAAIPTLEDRGLVLVGRRHLRSNNSWMHNINVLVKGAPRCTLQIHPDDAVTLGLADGAPASITSRVGSVLGAGGGDRLHPPRRGEPAPRLGPRHAGDEDAHRRRTRRRQLQRVVRRRGDGPVVRHVGPQRHPRHRRPRSRLSPSFHVCVAIFVSQSAQTATQTWFSGVIAVGGTSSTRMFMLTTGNSQGCTPFAPQGALRRVGLCRLRHGTRTRRRAPNSFDTTSTVLAWGANPVPVWPCRSRPCSCRRCSSACHDDIVVVWPGSRTVE